MNNKEKQRELREIQQRRDKNNTFGHDWKDPCKKERAMSLECIEMSRENSGIDCTAYFENFKKCKKFWNAVQEYRCMHMKKKRSDLPHGHEMDMWRSQLPEWLITEKLKPIVLNDEK